MAEQKKHPSGFTRADLLVVLGCVCFLAIVWIRPSLAGVAARNDEVVCANNLRHVGQGFAQWTQDREETYAWWLPASSASSSKSQPWSQNIWFQYFWISNELRSPRYLADPSDDSPSLRVATSWDDRPGGLLHPAFRNNAISYFLGLHATPLQPQSILSGDGNIRGGAPEGCSSGIYGIDVARSNAMWPENGHGNRGNVLFVDGRVTMTDSAELKDVISWDGNRVSGFDRGNWNTHFLKPRMP